eukprot:s876_g2.t2
MRLPKQRCRSTLAEAASMADDDVADLLDEALETAKKEAPAEPKPNEPKDSDKEKDKEEKESKLQKDFHTAHMGSKKE